MSQGQPPPPPRKPGQSGQGPALPPRGTRSAPRPAAADPDQAETMPELPPGARARGTSSRSQEQTMAEPAAGGPPAPAPAARGDLAGQVIGGCRIEKMLGRGGMATVYLAKQVDLERDVALKILSPRLTQDPRQVEQFSKEAKLIARLEHPNVVSIYGVGREDETHYLIVQLVRGGSLRKLLEEKTRFDGKTATEFVKQIALGLRESHRLGIIHRDVKPDNVLVAPGPTLKLTDFGLARVQSESAPAFGTGQVVGTPHYMSPEQVDARQVDHRTDIYALGATFYHLLVGEPPFKAPTTIELLLKHVNEPIVPPHERVPGLPPRLSAVVARMMAKDPAARYPDIDAVLVDLEAPAAAAPSPAPAPPPPPASRIPASLAQEVLPPLVFVPPVAPPPRGTSWMGLGLGAATCLALAFGAGPLRVVIGDLQSGDTDTVEPLELAATAALGRLRAELARAPEPERLAALRELATKRSGTAAAREVEAELKAHADRATDELRKALAARLAAAQAHAAKGELGPALDALGATSQDERALPEGDAHAKLRAELEAGIDERGLRWVPPGDFIAGDGARRATATTTGVYLERREVTCAEWARFLASRPDTLPPAGWTDRTPPDGAGALPVTGVSLRDALAYARARGRRLPTALEWEKAARGTDGRTWPWGDDDDAQACVWGSGPGLPLRPAGSAPKDTSPYGLVDMAGNAAELVLAPGSTPSAPAARIVAGGVVTRVLACCRPAFFQDGLSADEGLAGVGFRCAVDALPPPDAGERR